MKILIGYDGSECARAALVDLQRAGLPAEADITLLSAADVFLPPEDSENEEEFPTYVPHSVRLAHERAKRAFDEAAALSVAGAKVVGEMFPRWNVKPEAVAGVPHWEIIAKAEEWKPDLIVVGSHGRSAAGRFFLGSVSQKVLYEAGCSVRISRGRELPRDAPVRLILGTDGSTDADAMIDTVAGRNWPSGTDVRLVTAIEAFHQYAGDPDTHLNRIRDIQTRAVARLTAAGLDVTTAITDEDPKSYLVRQAEKWNADCVFLGAKGHRLFERLLLGSVSSAVAARAGCSVEVVRRIR